MHAARRTRLHRCALICALFFVIIQSTAVASAHSVLFKAPKIAVDANLTSARLTIKDGVFGRVTLVVAKGGTLTLKNLDSVAYRIKIGATLVVIPAKGSKTIPLPQRGVFSITCAKVPSLKATLTVK